MMKIPKSAKIRIDAQGQALKGTIEFADKDVITLDNVDSINTVLRNIYEKEGNSLGDLINDKRIVIASSKVWDKYNLSNGKFFIKNDKVKDEPVVIRSTPTVVPTDSVPVTPVVDDSKKDTVVVSDPVVAEAPVVSSPVVSDPAPVVVPDTVLTDESDKEEEKEDVAVVHDDGALDVTDAKTSEKKKTNSKTKVKLKKIGVGALAVIAAGVVLCVGLKSIFDKDSSNSNTNDNKRNDDRRVDTSPIPESTPTLPSDEELIQGMIEEPEETEEVISYSDEDTYETGYVESEEIVEEGPTYDYSDKGSVVRYDDMETQLNVVNEICDSLRPCELENLVVGSDYDAIHTICSMRNNVLNGTCSPEYFTNCIIDYTYENSTVFGDKPIQEFGTLSPFGKYVVIVASETILPLCDKNYEYTTPENVYRLDVLYDSDDYMINDLYRYLTDKPKSK